MLKSIEVREASALGSQRPRLIGVRSRAAQLRRLLVDAARRHSRVSHEAEDLAHDVIVSALRRNIPLEDAARYLRRAVGLHGAFLARTAARRRAREQAVDRGAGVADTRDHVDDGLSTLSPSLRTTLLLLLSGLDKAEVRYALGITDAALRKRFQALRAHGRLARPAMVVRAAHPQVRRSQVQLLPSLAAGGARVLAVADPDGHGLIFSEVLTPEGAAATTGTKGTPCSTDSSRTSPSSSS